MQDRSQHGSPAATQEHEAVMAHGSTMEREYLDDTVGYFSRCHWRGEMRGFHQRSLQTTQQCRCFNRLSVLASIKTSHSLIQAFKARKTFGHLQVHHMCSCRRTIAGETVVATHDVCRAHIKLGILHPVSNRFALL